jgi:glycosyltransferase involved in cell wall biosynthesis
VKVLHVGLETTATRPGGLNRYLEQLVLAERAAGLDADAVVLGDAPLDGQVEEGHPVIAAAPGRAMALEALAVERAVRRRPSPDLADLHFAGTASIAALLGALRKVPQVVHFQGPWADESHHAGAGRLNVAAKRGIERRVYRHARRCVTLSSAFAHVLEDRYGVAPWSIQVLAPGVDLERFSPGDRAAARSALDVDADRVVLAVRRLVPRTGLDVLVSAWAEASLGADHLLVVVGDGPSEGSLRHLAATLGVSGSVRFFGRADDDELVTWYRAADLTVVPSVALEGYGLVVLESLACGTPVVGTDVAGLSEALEATGQGPAVAAGDAGALAVALRARLANPQDFAARAARRAAAEEHGWAGVAARHVELYERVLRDEEPPHVVVLDHTAVLSGAELAIARAVLGVGDRACVHSILGEDGPLRARLEAAGASVEVRALPGEVRTLHRDAVGHLDVAQALGTARYVVWLARRLRALRPDVVHANTLKSALYGGLAARLAGVPCVWHVRDRLEPPALPRGVSRLVRAAARLLPTVVVANSASTLATVGIEGGHVVPSPLDPSIAPRSGPNDGGGPVRFTILGRLAPWKGQRLAIGAFADAFPTGGHVLRVVGAPMFGEDEYAASLSRLAAELGVAERVELCGFVEDVAGVLADTDVLIHASLDPEPFGQVVVEALGAGCAVVVPDAGGPAEIVTDGVDALLYPIGDRAALAAALRRLAEQPELRAALGTAGERTAAAYTPTALAPRLLEAWDDARRRGPWHRLRARRDA